jgi:hypothetical protein
VNKVHFNRRKVNGGFSIDGAVSCGVNIGNNLLVPISKERRDVTCLNCKRTKIFRRLK